MKPEPHLFSRLLLVLAIMMAIPVIGLLIWKGPGYCRLKYRQFAIHYAHEALAKKDFAAAASWGVGLLRVDPRNAATVRLIADIEEAQGLPDVLKWRARVVQFEPGNVDNYYAWAKSALAAGNLDVVLYVLQKVPPQVQQNSAPYHELMAAWAAATRKFDLADSHFSQAARIEPKNPAHAVNLATLRLQSANPDIAANARQELERFTEDPAMRLQALRALLGDAVRKNELERILILRKKLLSVANHELGDDLLCLHVIQGTAEFSAELARIESAAAGNFLKVVQVADWMTAHKLTAEALRWLNDQPRTAGDLIPVQMSTADAHMACADWNGLIKFLANKNWKHLDFMRKAMILRAERETNMKTYATGWEKLAASLNERGEDSLLLGQLVHGWGWKDEATGLFWSAAQKNGPARRLALRNLWIQYAAIGDTAGLLRVAQNFYKDKPDELTAKNNFAFLSLLLGVNQAAATRLAGEVAVSSPPLPAAVCTYAYSLHLAGKKVESLSVMQRLSEEELKQPGIALYYALVLYANGQKDSASKYASLVVKDRLLPEEKELFAGLQAGLTKR